MFLLVLALVVFGVVHLIPAIPRAKAWATQQLGKSYGPVYGVLSLLLLIATIMAFRNATTSELYAVPSFGRYANFILSLIAFILIGVFMFRGSWRNSLKYPMGLAVVVWAVGHMLANGDSRSLVFFGGFTVIAVLQMFFASRLVERQVSEVRGGHNLLSVLFGIAAYGVMAQIHGAVIGMPVVSIAGFTP